MLALYILAGWILAGTVVLIVLYHQKSMKMTSTTRGEVVSAEEREVRTEHERRDETVVTCRYVVGGQEHKVAHVFRGLQARRFPAGTPLPVRYNPAEPHMARIAIKSR